MNDIWFEIGRQVVNAAIYDFRRINFTGKELIIDIYNELYIGLKRVLRKWILPFKHIFSGSRLALAKVLFLASNSVEAGELCWHIGRYAYENWLCVDVHSLSRIKEIKLSDFIDNRTFYLQLSTGWKVRGSGLKARYITIKTRYYNHGLPGAYCLDDYLTHIIFIPSKEIGHIILRDEFSCDKYAAASEVEYLKYDRGGLTSNIVMILPKYSGIVDMRHYTEQVINAIFKMVNAAKVEDDKFEEFIKVRGEIGRKLGGGK